MSHDPNSRRKIFQTSIFGHDVKCVRCCLLPDNRLFLVELYGNHGYVFDPESQQWDTLEFDNIVNDVTVLNNPKFALLTSGIKGFQQLKISNFMAKQYKKSGGSLKAVSAFCDKIVVHNDVRKLSVMDLTGNVVITINTKYDPWYVTTDKSNCVYWTNGKYDEIHCEQINGPRRFIYHNTGLLQCPSGLALDKRGSLYVAGYSSNNVIKISHHGQYQGEILQETNGIIHPCDIVFNDARNEIIVLNENGTSICIYEL